MTPEDFAGQAIRKHPKGRSIGFGGGVESQVYVSQHVATVTGRAVHVQTETGEVVISGQSMIFVRDGEIIAVEGANPYRLKIGDLRKLLSEDDVDKLLSSLQKNRENKKKKLKITSW